MFNKFLLTSTQYACLILSLAAEVFKFHLYLGKPFKEFMSKMQAA